MLIKLQVKIMKDEKYISIPKMAKILGISRIAVYRKVKKGQIEAVRFGRNYAIPRKIIAPLLGRTLAAGDKRHLDRVVLRTVKEYGEVLIKLGNG